MSHSIKKISLELVGQKTLEVEREGINARQADIKTHSAYTNAKGRKNKLEHDY